MPPNWSNEKSEAALLLSLMFPSADDERKLRAVHEITDPEPAVIDDVNVAAPDEAIVNAVLCAFCEDPLEPAGAVWNMIDPPAPVPLPALPLIVKLAPAVSVVPATTD